MVPMSHMVIPTSHMMVLIITLLGFLNFNLLFKFNICKKSNSTKITYVSIYMIISHLIVPIEWIPYSQKEWIL